MCVRPARQANSSCGHYSEMLAADCATAWRICSSRPGFLAFYGGAAASRLPAARPRRRRHRSRDTAFLNANPDRLDFVPCENRNRDRHGRFWSDGRYRRCRSGWNDLRSPRVQCSDSPPRHYHYQKRFSSRRTVPWNRRRTIITTPSGIWGRAAAGSPDCLHPRSSNRAVRPKRLPPRCKWASDTHVLASPRRRRTGFSGARLDGNKVVDSQDDFARWAIDLAKAILRGQGSKRAAARDGNEAQIGETAQALG